MDPGSVLVVGIGSLVALACVFAFATARGHDSRRALDGTATARPGEPSAAPSSDRLPVPVGTGAGRSGARELERAVVVERRERHASVPDISAPPAPAVVPDEETLGVTRRQVLNRGIVTTMALAVSGFGAAMVGMLWPSLSGGFGSKIRVGKLDDIMSQIGEKREPFYLAAGRLYINPYPVEDASKAKRVQAYSAVADGYSQGVVALYQKCVHLGCRVPWCKTSQWFECPCHGSQYNRVGEKKGGPAPRGLDRFVATVDGGVLVVDTKTIIPGPPIGTNTTGQEAEGPHCVGGSAEK